MIAVNVPARQRERDAVERAHGALAAAEDTDELVELDHAGACDLGRWVSVGDDDGSHWKAPVRCRMTVPAQRSRRHASLLA